MNFKFVALILFTGLEAFLIFFILKKLRKKMNQTSDTEILLKNIEGVFQKNDFHLNIDKLEELGDAIRMFKLKTQNDENLKAELRVYDKFKILLNELWRLKKEDRNKMAANLLILIRNNLQIEFENMESIEFQPEIKDRYIIVSDVNKNDILKIIRPAWLVNKKVVIKGKAVKHNE